MRLRRIPSIVLMVLVIASLLQGCPFTKKTDATPAEQTRLNLRMAQSYLDGMLSAGEVYIAIHPEKKADWQKRVLPMFKVANTALRDLINEAKAKGVLNPADLLLKLNPRILEVEMILLEWGAVKKAQ